MGLIDDMYIRLLSSNDNLVIGGILMLVSQIQK